jgi:hypothetical protein
MDSRFRGNDGTGRVSCRANCRPGTAPAFCRTPASTSGMRLRASAAFAGPYGYWGSCARCDGLARDLTSARARVGPAHLPSGSTGVARHASETERVGPPQKRPREGVRKMSKGASISIAVGLPNLLATVTFITINFVC